MDVRHGSRPQVEAPQKPFRKLTVLAVHNRYLWHGGEDECFEDDVSLLRTHGNQVDVYVEDNKRIEQLGNMRTALRAVFSLETYRKIRKQLRSKHYDIVHAHNTFPLVSPALYYAAHHEGVPVVQTLHNYRLICLDATLFRNGRVCEDCVGKSLPWPGILHGCYRGSRLGSSALALMLVVHRLLGTWDREVDMYVSLGEFALSRLVQARVATRSTLRPNFLPHDPGPGTGDGGFALFASRLAKEKGLATLVDAWKRLGAAAPPLKIVGDGPARPQIEAACAEVAGIEYAGHRTSAEVLQCLSRAEFLVFPSLWYENCPHILVEAMACGVPVIASNVGAASQMIKPGVTGLHFRPGDSEDLARQVTWLRSHPVELKAMRAGARQEFVKQYSADVSYATLLEIVRLVQENRKAERA